MPTLPKRNQRPRWAHPGTQLGNGRLRTRTRVSDPSWGSFYYNRWLPSHHPFPTCEYTHVITWTHMCTHMLRRSACQHQKHARTWLLTSSQAQLQLQTPLLAPLPPWLCNSSNSSQPLSSAGSPVLIPLLGWWISGSTCFTKAALCSALAQRTLWEEGQQEGAQGPA